MKNSLLALRERWFNGWITDGADAWHTRWHQCLLALGPLILTINLGMVSGYSATLIPQLQNSTKNDGFTVAPSDVSWIASIAVLPMTFGCILGGVLMERYGRRTIHLITCFPLLIGWLTIYLSNNLCTLLIGRFLTGLSGGLLGPSTGVYVSESSSPKLRGILLAAISMAVAIGLFLVHLLDTCTRWRVTAIISATMAPIAAAILYHVHESPVWLLRNGRVDAACKAHHWLRGDGGDAQREYDEMLKRHTESTVKPTFERLKQKDFWRPLLIITVFIVCNQWMGVNAITFYTINILRSILNEGFNEYVAMLLVDFMRVMAACLACYCLRHVSRRRLAVISGGGTCVSLLVLSIHAHFLQQITFMYFLPLLGLICYIIFISIGFVPLPWAMMGEIFPNDVRNVGSSLTAMFAFLAFFSVVKTGPNLFANFGTDGTFGLYACVAICGTIFVWFYLPETKDRTLYEIEDQMKTKDDQPV